LRPSDARNGLDCLNIEQSREESGRNRLAIPALTRKIEADSVTRIVSSSDLSGISGYSRCPVFLFLVKAIGAISINYVIFRFCHKRAAKLRNGLMKSYMSMPYEQYINKNSALMLQTAQDYVAQFVEQTLVSWLRLISEGVVVLSIMIMLWWVNGYALLMLTAMMVFVTLLYDKVFRKKMVENGTIANRKMGEVLRAIREGVSGLKEIRLLGITAYYANIVKNGAHEHAKYMAKSQTIINSPRYLLEISLVIFVVMVVWMSSEGGGGGILPALGMFGVAGMRLIPSVNLLISGIAKIRLSKNATEILCQDLKFLSDHSGVSREGEISSGYEVKGDRFENVELINVYYKYPSSDAYVLKGVNMVINRGEFIGVVGQSGAGKTTLVDLILGLLRGKSGEIRINGNPVNDNDNEWKSHVAYLPQMAFISDDTIRKNVALGIEDDRIHDDKVWSALKQACLCDAVESMPDGINTKLGESGIRLSGGQKQRISLARAFYFDRDVLVMDESTSALDAMTESDIVSAIRDLRGHKTIIVIAHRKSTLEACDKVFEVQNGIVKELAL
jgi:ABC-type multidrug transport system fused ATPase/permease subunit